ncbi:MAG: c-type cytochrome [Pseudomonadota bacterium]
MTGVEKAKMRAMKKGILLAALLAVGAPALAADVAAGQKLAAEVCAACHGPDGNSPNPQFPIIAGQHKDYLQHSLEGYKTGKRQNAIMQGFAANLSAQDIANLAAYFSQQQGLVTKY